jgi:hypothetical protein
MGKMCRLKTEAAVAFAMQEALPAVQQRAQAHGLPVNDQTAALLKDLLQFGIFTGLAGLQTKYGIFTGITDESPYFQHFGAHALVGSLQGARPIAAVQPPQPVQQPQPVMQPAAPVFAPQPVMPPAPMPVAPTQPWAGQPHSHIPPPPPNAIMPGQPLPPLQQPQHPQHMGGTRTVPPHQVPVHAPVMNGDHPPSLTQAPVNPVPTILE